MIVKGTVQPVNPPALTRWQIVWRNLVAAAVSALAWSSVWPAQWDIPMRFWTDVGVGLGCFVLYQFRRRQPLTVAALTAAASGVSSIAFGPAVLAFISLSTRRRWAEMLPVAVISIGMGLVYQLIEPVNNPSPWYLNVLLSALAAGVAIGIGMYIGARRELILTLQDRAERAEREQAMRVAQARLHERASIAREMHDVLAHRISLVAMHAGALSYRRSLSPEESAEAAGVIQANAHQALTDLREILGVLREGDSASPPEQPQPTIGDIASLVHEAARAGMPVTLGSTVDEGESVPESVGRSAYRIVQEALTNARKHARDCHVHVDLSGTPGRGLSVAVRNGLRVGAGPAQIPGAGLGLVGLTERAQLAGGRLEHGRTADGDFEVRAWLPWPS